jgi:hypothetical protein
MSLINRVNRSDGTLGHSTSDLAPIGRAVTHNNSLFAVKKEVGQPVEEEAIETIGFELD